MGVHTWVKNGGDALKTNDTDKAVLKVYVRRFSVCNALQIKFYNA